MTSIDLAHPHDHLVRRFLIDTELMTDLLIHYPQKDVDRKAIRLLDLKHLECKSPVAIDKNLVEGRGDLRFATTFKGRKRQSNVFLLLEHQSAIDYDFRFRGLDYIVQEYHEFRRETKGKKKFPYPVVVVLYHGKTSWKHMPTMDEMIDIVPGAKTGLLDYQLILIDLANIAKLAIKLVADMEKAQKDFSTMSSTISTIEKSAKHATPSMKNLTDSVKGLGMMQDAVKKAEEAYSVEPLIETKRLVDETTAA